MKPSTITRSIFSGALILAPLAFGQASANQTTLSPDQSVASSSAPTPYPSADAAGPNGAQNGSSTNGVGRPLASVQKEQETVAQNQAPPVFPQQTPYPQQGQNQSGQNPQAVPPNGPPPNYQGGYPGGYQGNYQPAPPPPAQITIPAGTFLTVRLNQALSSDRNHQGDGFSATLAKPLVVDGWVVADRGQTIAGRVSDAKKAGRIEGTSSLGVELTDLTLIDGQPEQVHTQLVNRSGGTTVGRDVAAVGSTTAVGAAAGAVADLGRGAAIGAGAGAGVGIIGVLLTRGRPTILYPEQLLTFRIDTPITVNTTRAPQAFRPVGPGDYEQPPNRPVMARPPYPAYPGYYGAPYAPYGYAYPYGYGYYPYYWGPSIGLRFGGFYGHRWR